MAKNHAPRFTSSLIVRTTEDDPLSRETAGFLLSLATDPDPGDTLTLAAVNGLGAGPILGRFGTLAWDPATAAFVYTRDDGLRAVQKLGEGETARERFQITAADAEGATANGRLIVEVAGVDDVPVARDRSQRLVEDAGTSVILGNLLAGTRGVDRNDTLSVTTVNGGTATTVDGTYGTLTWDPLDGDYDYVLANAGAAVQGLGAGERGTDVFTFTIADGKGGESSASVRVNVVGANDAPTAPDLNFVAGLLIVVVDLAGSGAADADGDPLSVVAVQGSGTPGSAVRGTYGTLTWQASDTGIYAQDARAAAFRALGAGQAGEDRFGITLSDGQGGFVTRNVVFTSFGRNDPALIEGGALGTVVEDVLPAASGRLVVIDPDAGEAAFAAPVTLAGTYGTFAFSAASGDWSYVLDNSRAAVQALTAGQVATDALAVASLDGTASATVTVSVVGTNAAPVAAPDQYTVAEGVILRASTSTGVLANDTGGDGALSVAPGSFVSVQGGSVTIGAGGEFTYQPGANFFGTDSFTYTLMDLDGDQVTGTVTITVTPRTDLIPAVDLDEVALGQDGFKILGEANGDYAGRSVSAAGDVNGDGFADVLVGADRNDSYGRTDNGAAYVVFGKAGGATVDLDGFAFGLGGFKIVGEATGDYAGRSVSAAGDVNKDGFADLIVGANGNNSDVGTRDGAAYVVFGKAGGLTVDLDRVARGQGGFKILGEPFESGSGGSLVSGAGDVNGDGFADLIVGAYNGLGAAYVVFGKAGGAAVDLVNVALGLGGFKILPEGDLDPAENSVSAAGDVNGDGFADLIVGNYRNGAYSQNNAAYVVFGKADGTAVDLVDVALGLGGFKIFGEARDDRAGISVSDAGDVNGDGFADLLVGANGSSSDGSTDNGAAYVVFGKAGGAAVDLGDVALGLGGFKILGEASGDSAGISVSAAGDVNGDGHADLLVGALLNDSDGSTDNGAAYVVFGKADGATVDLDDVATGRGGFKILGQDSYDRAGTSVSAAGDVNKDGFADLLVGAPLNSSDNNTDNGAAYVIFGRADWVTETPLL